MPGRNSVAMKTSRVITLFLALVAAAGAFLLARGQRPTAPEPVAMVAPAPVATDDVLVAAKDLPSGRRSTMVRSRGCPGPRRA